MKHEIKILVTKVNKKNLVFKLKLNKYLLNNYKNMAGKKGVELLKQISDFMVKSKGYDSVIKKVQITGGGNGKCIGEFTVSEEHLNRGGGLHGGFIATLVDNITTYALMTKDAHPGVSVDLHVSYLKAAKEGDQVIVDATAVKVGKTLAYLECELRHKKDNSIIAKGSQTKFINF